MLDLADRKIAQRDHPALMQIFIADLGMREQIDRGGCRGRVALDRPASKIALSKLHAATFVKLENAPRYQLFVVRNKRPRQFLSGAVEL